MSYLLDSHILLWWLNDDPKLSETHRNLIGDGETSALVSSITLAELSIKTSLGKLEVTPKLNAVVAESGFEFLAFNERHAAVLRDLPFHHRDPFGRMLIAQATVEGLIFLTDDQDCKKYDIVTR